MSSGEIGPHQASVGTVFSGTGGAQKDHSEQIQEYLALWSRI